MSLIVTVCTSEGIVMASDSRSTYTKTESRDQKAIVKFGVHYSDTTYKTFLCDNRIGISTCGDSTVMGRTIAGHIEDFSNNAYSKDDSVDDVAQKLSNFFDMMPSKSNVIFHVTGYKKIDGKDAPIVYTIKTGNKQISLENQGGVGANWDGETATLIRLMKNSYVVPEGSAIPIGTITLTQKDENGTDKNTILKNQIAIPAVALRQPDLEVAWELMTLQDGIDFAEYAIKTTIDTMRFQVAPKTVGGPIDILVIKPNGAQWIRHKKLHA